MKPLRGHGSNRISGQGPGWPALGLAVLLSNGITTFLAGFASQIYTAHLDLFILVFVSNTLCSTFLYLLLPTMRDSLRSGTLRSQINWLPLLLLISFIVLLSGIGFSFPSLLDLQDYLLDSAYIAPVSIAAVASSLMTIIAIRLLPFERVLDTAAWKSLRRYLPGMGIGLLFAFAYFILSMILNPADFNTNNVFFAADANNWRVRLATQEGYTSGSRAVHPYALLLLRPLIGMLATLLNGNWHYAGLISLAAAGGMCVFGIWMLVKAVSPSPFFPLIMAVAFGASATQLLFSSVMEVYIFSALSLICFFLLLQRGRPALPAVIASALVTLGLLLTNFVQSMIALTVARPRAAFLLKFLLLVLLLAIALSISNHLLYPNADLFFLPANLFAEDRFATNITEMTFSEIRSRVFLLVKDMTMFNLIAPEPYQSEMTKEGRDPFPRFNFFNQSFYRYSSSGAIALGSWIVLLLYAGIRFALKGRANPPLAVASAGTMIFNFALHLNYGFEPFLYSANWTYALIIWVSYSIASTSTAKWVQAVLLIFVLFSMINNAGFVYQIIAACAPYFG